MSGIVDERARIRRHKGCVHPFLRDEPSSYAGWHEWAAKRGKKHKQHPCPKCGLYLWDDVAVLTGQEPT